MSLRVLLASAEVYPFAKVGGLADVAGSLPKALRRLGVDVRVVMPYYGDVQRRSAEFGIKRLDVCGVPVVVGDSVETFDLFAASLPGTRVPVYFVKSERFFDRRGIYFDPDTKRDFPDQAERLVFFCKSVLQVAPAVGFVPDVLHANDHHTALLPAYLKLAYGDHPVWRRTASVLTIHNIAYQGVFEKNALRLMGLGEELFYPTGPFEFFGKVNFLKIGILFADAVNTVSPTYAKEIQTPQYGEGLEGVLSSVSHKLFGILNGVDYSVWDPSVDAKIEHNYSPKDLSGKRKMKSVLLREVGLPDEPEKPVLGMIGRMAYQKGFDIVAEALPRLVEFGVKLVVLGSGKPEYEEMFRKASRDYPRQVAVCTEFNDPLAHKIEAGADMFLMPSRFEPCGLNQLYSLRYGTVPVVRRTGGLADTVIDADEFPDRGTGFLFDDPTPQALLSCIERALEAFRDKKRWEKIMLRGMRQDFSWEASARKYIELYERAIQLQRQS